MRSAHLGKLQRALRAVDDGEGRKIGADVVDVALIDDNSATRVSRLLQDAANLHPHGILRTSAFDGDLVDGLAAGGYAGDANLRGRQV